MKNTFQKLFSKKEDFNSSALENCSQKELIQIIAKMDGELGDARNNLEVLSQGKSVQMRELDKTKEELQLYKEHSEVLQTETNKISRELDDHKTLIESRNHEIKVLRETVSKLQVDLSVPVEPLPQSPDELKEMKAKVKSFKSQMRQHESSVKEYQAEVLGKTERINVLEEEVNSLKTSHSSQIKDLQETIQALKTSEELKAKQIEQLEKELADNQKDCKSIESLETQVQTLTEQLAASQELVVNYEAKEPSLTIQIEELKQKNTQLQEKLESAQNKREVARNEVLRLNQKLASMHVEESPVPTLKPKHASTPVSLKGIPVGDLEFKALVLIKEQVNGLYKDLMELMMNANTLRSQEHNIYYQITAAEFSLFEKAFNKVMMNVHEAAENPNLIHENEGWMSKFSNMVKIQPSKLFSCMVRTDNPVPNTVRRPSRSDRSFNGIH